MYIVLLIVCTTQDSWVNYLFDNFLNILCKYFIIILENIWLKNI